MHSRHIIPPSEQRARSAGAGAFEARRAATARACRATAGAPSGTGRPISESSPTRSLVAGRGARSRGGSAGQLPKDPGGGPAGFFAAGLLSRGWAVPGARAEVQLVQTCRPRSPRECAIRCNAPRHLGLSSPSAPSASESSRECLGHHRKGTPGIGNVD